MSRTIRRVPLNWEHPKSVDVSWSRGVPVHVPLFEHEDYADHLAEWEAMDPEEREEEPRPELTGYMPDFSHVPEDQMGYCLYETTSEGTPKTPVFRTLEEVARWAADHGVSAFGNHTATYEQWLATVRAGWAPGAVHTPATGLVSGVEASTWQGDGK